MSELEPSDAHLMVVLEQFAAFRADVAKGEQPVIEASYRQQLRDLFAPQLEALKAERDEADRFSGAAAREVAHLREASAARASWLDKAKRQWGVDTNVSFDVVWAEALALKSPRKDS